MIREDWEKYTPCGIPISGTPFVAFKVPLIGTNWTMTNLMDKWPNMNLLIDLTSTSKYYKKYQVRPDVEYVKIFTKALGSKIRLKKVLFWEVAVAICLKG